MKTVLLTITYADDIDHSTVEALVDSMTDDENVVMVCASQITEPYVRVIEIEDDTDTEETVCNCAYKDDPYKAPEQHAMACPVRKLAG